MFCVLTSLWALDNNLLLGEQPMKTFFHSMGYLFSLLSRSLLITQNLPSRLLVLFSGQALFRAQLPMVDVVAYNLPSF